MFYTVECTYSDPASEQEWNEFYSQEKLPALVGVTGFITSQRFKALKPGFPVYLAIHTVRNADVITSDEYRLKGGGNFSRWQSFITDWHRNLYHCEGTAPAVFSEQILLLSPQPLNFIDTIFGYCPLEMRAAGLDNSPARRVAYVVARESAAQLAEVPEVCLYQPLTPQLHNPVSCVLSG